MGDISIWVWIIGGLVIIAGIVAVVIAGNRETSSSDDDLLASRLVEFEFCPTCYRFYLWKGVTFFWLCTKAYARI